MKRDDLKVGDIVQWDVVRPPVRVRVDRIDHNAEVAWCTFLEGSSEGSQGPLFIENLSDFVIQENLMTTSQRNCQQSHQFTVTITAGVRHDKC